MSCANQWVNCHRISHWLHWCFCPKLQKVSPTSLPLTALSPWCILHSSHALQAFIAKAKHWDNPEQSKAACTKMNVFRQDLTGRYWTDLAVCSHYQNGMKQANNSSCCTLNKTCLNHDQNVWCVQHTNDICMGVERSISLWNHKTQFEAANLSHTSFWYMRFA